eukprot:5083199-Lingulodinium_polyedra.AAC.1
MYKTCGQKLSGFRAFFGKDGNEEPVWGADLGIRVMGEGNPATAVLNTKSGVAKRLPFGISIEKNAGT